MAGREGDAGESGSVVSPVWAEVDHIREEMLWDRFDAALTARALTRLFAAVVWFALALVTGASAWWGVGLLVGAALSLLHARRRTVLLIVDGAGPFAPVVRWLLPYPRVPHINAVGVIESAAAVLAAAGTGWVGDAFGGTAATRAAAPAAVIMVGLFGAGIVLNLVSHVAWELDPGARFFLWIRPLLALLLAVIALALLWPSGELDAAYSATLLAAVASAVGILLAGWAAQAFHTSAVGLTGQRIDRVRRAVQAVDAQQVHQLKNMARILYQRSDEISSRDLRDRVRGLSVSISSLEQRLKHGQDAPPRCVAEIVDGFLGIDERFARLRHIDADLDPGDLTPGDAELIAIAVGDLCSNAVNAQASTFRVGLRATPGEHGSRLTLEAECECGRTLPEVPEESSLMRLATLLHYNRGSFVISDHHGRHRFTLSWPSTGQFRRQAEDEPTTDQDRVGAADRALRAVRGAGGQP